MHTDTIADTTLAVDYGTSLPDMIAAGKYDWVNPNITAKHFPVEGAGSKPYRAKIFDFNRSISSEDAVAAMKAEGFTPASHVHGLAFGATLPEEQRKHPIACLGSSAQVYGSRFVVCLYRCGDGRYLGLYGWSGSWGGVWRVLGVQEVSAA